MYIWHVREEYTSDVRNIKLLEQSINELEWTYIKGVIQEDYYAAKTHVDHLSKDLKQDLINSYPDLNVLKDELENKKNNPRPYYLTVLKKRIDNDYFHGLKSDENDIVICDNSGILLDISLSTAPEKYPNEWDELYSRTLNPEITKKAVDMVLNKKENYAWWFFKPQNYDKIIINVNDVDEPNLEALHQIFIKHGLEGLKYVKMIVPGYITETGDIFGLDDIDEYGIKTKNNKLVVLQTYSLYQQLISFHSDNLKEYDVFREKITNDRRLSLVESAFSMVVVLVLVIILIYFMIMFANMILHVTEEDEDEF
jgi:hypothetical protein